MLSSPHIAAHRSLHVLRASYLAQYHAHRKRYVETPNIVSKTVYRTFHQAIREIDALLDDGPTVLASDRDWADARENTRLAGRDPGEDACDRQDGTHTRPARRVGAWGQFLKGAIVLAILLVWCLLMKGVER